MGSPQRIGGAARQIACREARAGKAQQQPARLDPIGNARGCRVGQRGDIGQHDHVGIGQQDILDRAVDQVGHRVERLDKVMGGRQQLQPFAIGRTRQQRHLAPFERIIRQADRPGRTRALDLEAGDPVAQLWRQGQGQLGLCCAIGKAQHAARQLALDPVGIQPARDHRDLCCAFGPRPLARDHHRAILEPGGAEPVKRARAFDDGQGAVILECCQQIGAPGLVQPVRNPERVERPL